MKSFSNLYIQLDQTTKTLGKIKALVQYFEVAQDDDKLWAVALLSHRRPKRTVNTNFLRDWAAEQGNIPLWLFEESYHVVGDLAETITLVLPPATTTSDESLSYWINFIRELEFLTVEQKKEKILWSWQRLNDAERFVFNKLITGSFRVGVSQQLVVKALAKYTGVKENILAHKLMGQWSPERTTIHVLLGDVDNQIDHSKPYPFYLAYALESEIGALGDPGTWMAERKWDGIRGQVIVRNHQLFVWSRGEELVTDKYPEYRVLLDILPEGTVIDGEILPFHNNRPMPFSALQTRIGRKTLGAKLLKEVPVAFVAYDILELNGEDVRALPMAERRKKLEIICNVSSEVLRLSPLIQFDTWEQLTEERERSRDFLSEGVMLKKKDSPYRNGRRKGDWWKWKIDPLTVDAVMIYAMPGSGRRANLYTDYTFAVYENDQLVPFAKAYSGLTDEEIHEVDRWVRKNTIERFGPVRSVKPELVFEIAFEGINKSTRHKSGIAVRFPRIHRWRKDKQPGEANTLNDLRQLLALSK
jgi:DNA ligase 1